MSEKISEEREQRVRRKKSDRREVNRVGEEASFSAWLASIVDRKKGELREVRKRQEEGD